VLLAISYFSSIGLAFLFIEIPLIQRGILSLGHSTYSFSIVVLALLLGSSAGSLVSMKFRWTRTWGMAALVGVSLATSLISGRLTEISLGGELIPKTILLGVTLLPLGFLMGIPFPVGLDYVARNDSMLVAWAWAINGCASVIASVLAAIFGLSFGFDLVLLLGTGFYALAALLINVHRSVERT
jgi:hypothetical protein